MLSKSCVTGGITEDNVEQEQVEVMTEPPALLTETFFDNTRNKQQVHVANSSFKKSIGGEESSGVTGGVTENNVE